MLCEQREAAALLRAQREEAIEGVCLHTEGGTGASSRAHRRVKRALFDEAEQPRESTRQRRGSDTAHVLCLGVKELTSPELQRAIRPKRARPISPLSARMVIRRYTTARLKRERDSLEQLGRSDLPVPVKRERLR